MNVMKTMSYQDLVVWQKSMDLVEGVYRLSESFPLEETYGLTNQVRRASVSVPSNIAEGHARKSTAEFKRFLSIAQGSLAETGTQLLLSGRLSYASESEIEPLLGLSTEISKMLSSLQSKLSARQQ